MENRKISRKELYDLVWSEPLTSVAMRLDVSYHTLKGVCKKMGIPLPDMGFWAKKQFGKAVHIHRMIENYEGMNSSTVVSFPENKSSKQSEGAQDATKLKALKMELASNLIVPEKLRRPDPLIQQFMRKKRSRKSHSGVEYYPEYDQLNIRVGEGLVKRAVLFMDTLIKGLKYRGHAVWCGSHETIVKVQDYECRIRLREKNRRVENQNSQYSWRSWDYQPTGVLVFKIDGYNGREWFDGKVLIEERLAEIIMKFEYEAEEHRIREEEFRIRSEARKRTEEEERQLKQRKKEELEKFRNLVYDAERWKRTIILREYIKCMESEHLRTGVDITDEWLNWAKLKIDWYDPWINGYDELLADVQRNKIWEQASQEQPRNINFFT